LDAGFSLPVMVCNIQNRLGSKIAPVPVELETLLVLDMGTSLALAIAPEQNDKMLRALIGASYIDLVRIYRERFLLGDFVEL
jgi:hypothetical protein